MGTSLFPITHVLKSSPKTTNQHMCLMDALWTELKSSVLGDCVLLFEMILDDIEMALSTIIYDFNIFIKNFNF